MKHGWVAAGAFATLIAASSCGSDGAVVGSGSPVDRVDGAAGVPGPEDGLDGWLVLGTVPGEARYHGSMTQAGDRLIIAGGLTESRSAGVRELVAFDTAEQSWDELASIPRTVGDSFDLTDALVTDGQLYVTLVECTSGDPIGDCPTMAVRPRVLFLSSDAERWTELEVPPELGPGSYIGEIVGVSGDVIYLSAATISGSNLIASYSATAGWSVVELSPYERHQVCLLDGELLVASFVDAEFAAIYPQLTELPGGPPPGAVQTSDARVLRRWVPATGLEELGSHSDPAQPDFVVALCTREGVITTPLTAGDGATLVGTQLGWLPYAAPMTFGVAPIVDDTGTVVADHDALGQLQGDAWSIETLPPQLAMIGPDDLATSGGQVYALVDGPTGQRLLTRP